MEQVQHEHPLDLVDLQPKYPHYEEYDDDEEEEEEENDSNTKWDFLCPCNLCGREINWYHRYYYKCTNSCDYLLHKFCAELPTMLKHRSHRVIDHTLTLQNNFRSPPSPFLFSRLFPSYFGNHEVCDICQIIIRHKEASYGCSKCDFTTHVNCVVASEENRIIYHPSHPHPLVSVTSEPILCKCDACGKKHMGMFYHCATCFCHSIHSECVFLPKKLLIQHPHPLILSYSFPKADQRAKFYPSCRICAVRFDDENLWIYKCEKCRYYAHLDCAPSRGEPFMSILLSAGLGKTDKNFKDADHPDLLNLPFPDQTYSIPQHLFFKEIGSKTSKTNEGNLNHISHQHPLSLIRTQTTDITRPASTRINSLSCHNPMKKIELLCNGCVRPIMSVPFFKCTNEDQCCNFVLHEWCTHLPAKVQNHPGHPQHTLILLPKVPGEFFGVFCCDVCKLPCNGFVYSCKECAYYIDVSCGFVPEKITHEAHPGHLLLRVWTGQEYKQCRACLRFTNYEFLFSCRTCDVNLHLHCALLLPQTSMHKYDKHPMNLSYLPIENHKSEYFCEICEEEFDPNRWFYHCYKCVQSMHSACAPLILQSETNVYSYYGKGVYEFVNIKLGGILNIEGHSHTLLFAQGIESDGRCEACLGRLKYLMIFKCLLCKFAIHYYCCEELSKQELAELHFIVLKFGKCS